MSWKSRLKNTREGGILKVKKKRCHGAQLGGHSFLPILCHTVIWSKLFDMSNVGCEN